MKLKSFSAFAALPVLTVAVLALTSPSVSAQLKLPGGQGLSATPQAAAPEPAQDDPTILAKEDAARERAESWLALLDNGQFADSWQETSELFKSRVPEDVWVKQMPSSRTPFGALKQRQLQGAKFKTKLPGTADVVYVSLEYTSSFAIKSEATETVTMAKEADGVWRVISYAIR